MKDLIILGISGSPNLVDWTLCNIITPNNFHDSSATLLVNGKVEAAFEEERLNRIKHNNFFPLNSIKKCLETKSLSHKDVDYFTFSVSEEFLDNLLKRLGYELEGRKFVQLLLSDIFEDEIDSSKLRFYHHHLAHAASTYFHSGFKQSVVLTIDGIGEGLSGSVYLGKANNLTLLRTISESDSLGNFYTHFTKYLGFKFFDEYKVMGLSGYGNPQRFMSIFETFYTLLPDGNYNIHSENFEKLVKVCKIRNKGEELLEIHKDIAASLQKTLEIIVFHILSYFQKDTQIKYLSLAGGVAQNSKLAGELAYSNTFEDVFIHPASSDSGLSVGSALACHHENLTIDRKEFVQISEVYWGSDNKNIEKTLSLWQKHLNFKLMEDVCNEAAIQISENKVIGWFQGRSEFGPRALGNRSILADPRPSENKSRVNRIIKMREGFRPFAPAVHENSLKKYFEIPQNGKTDFPFMNFVLKVKKNYRDKLGAITHTDGTARIQTVTPVSNSKFWDLLDSFKKITGFPILLNTSFNNNVEPIVDSVQDAITCLLTNDLDSLFVNDFLIRKKDNIFDSEGTFKILLLDHFELKNSISEKCIFDKYLKNSINISMETMNVLKIESKVSFNNMLVNQKNEILSLWRSRVIHILPF